MVSLSPGLGRTARLPTSLGTNNIGIELEVLVLRMAATRCSRCHDKHRPCRPVGVFSVLPVCGRWLTCADSRATSPQLRELRLLRAEIWSFEARSGARSELRSRMHQVHEELMAPCAAARVAGLA